MDPIWVVALIVIVVVLVGWAGGMLVIDARRRNRRSRGTGSGDEPAPLPPDRDTINGGVIRGDPGQTNTPPGEV